MHIIEIDKLCEIVILRSLISLILITLYILFYLILNIVYLKLCSTLNFTDYGEINSRELAIILCIITIVFIASYRDEKVLNSIKNVFKAFFVKKIIIVYLFLIIYTIIIVNLLETISYWESFLFKSMLIWILFSASGTIFKLNNINKNKYYFRDILIENIKLSAIIEFISGLYTFNLFIEIIIVILAFIIGGSLALLDSDKIYKSEKKYQDTKKF